MLSRDGVGDEVYAAAYIRRYDRATGQLLQTFIRQTMPYGDVAQFGGTRIQAGTRSPTGGIQDGDAVSAGPLLTVRAVPPQNATLPLRLWEGPLTDGADALVITPSLWEQDGSAAFHGQWVLQQQTLNMSIFSNTAIQRQITETRFGAIVSGAAGVNTGPQFGSQTRQFADMMLMQFGFPLASLLQTTSDRPIGLLSSVGGIILPTQAIVLTREIIESALSGPALGVVPSPMGNVTGVVAPRPGLIYLQFQDGPNLSSTFPPERPAIYQMYIQVERMP